MTKLILMIAAFALASTWIGCAHTRSAKSSADSLFGMPVRTLSPEDISESNTLYAYMRGDLLALEGHPQQSIPELTRAISQSPNAAYLYLSRAMAYATVQQLSEAEADCVKALELSPTLSEAKLLLARLLAIQGQFARATPMLEDVMRAAPQNKETYPLLAVAHINTHHYGKAVAVMKRLLAEDPDALVAYYYLGALYGTYLKQPGLAVQMYRKLLDRDPRNVSVYSALVQLYVDRNDPARAVAVLQEAFASGVDDVALKLRLSALYYQQKNYAKASEVLEAVLQRTPNSNKVRYYLGVIYEEAGDFDKAAAQYHLITADSTFYKDAVLREALYYYRQSQLGAAIGVLQMASMRAPKVEEFYPLLAVLQEEAGTLPAARVTLERGVKALPKSAPLLYALAVAHDKLKNTDAALKLMHQALVLDPGNVSAMNYIGYTYTERGVHLDEAETVLLKAVAAQPQDGYILDSLGWLYFKKNEYGKAVALLEQAARLTPNEPVVHKHLAELYAAMGRKRDAIVEYRLAIALSGPRSAAELNVEKMEEALHALETR